VSFVQVENLRGSADNEDSFVVSAGGSLSGVLDGGAGGFDSMIVDGGGAARVEYIATGPTSGAIVRDGVALNFTGLEPVWVANGVADVVVDLSAVSDNAKVTSDGSKITIAADVPPLDITFESVTFDIPTGSLTINLGEDQGIFPLLNEYLGEDVFAGAGLDDLIAAFVSGDAITFEGNINLGGASLTVDGQVGLDTVIVTGSLTAGAIHFKAEEINVEATGSVSGTSVNFEAAATGNGLIPEELTKGLYLAAPHATTKFWAM